MTSYILGNFDGVHPGHLWLIDQARAVVGDDVQVLTFEPHPRQFFAPDRPEFRLTNTLQREAFLKSAGVRDVIALDFNEDLADLSAQEFASAVLRDRLDATAIFAGADFHFGKGRGGDMFALKDLGRTMGFQVHAIDLHQANGRTLSSSRIRSLLMEGHYDEACNLWERKFCVQGEVMKGDQLGRTLGFPTANLDFGAYLRPAFGVYASRASLPDGRVIDSVTNLGRRPTVDGVQDRFETHLFDFNEDLYGQVLSVELTGAIRSEQKFAGLDALKAQIAVDCETARSMLARSKSTSQKG